MSITINLGVKTETSYAEVNENVVKITKVTSNTPLIIDPMALRIKEINRIKEEATMKVLAKQKINL